MHVIISAANDYCRLIDDDWDRIADWYHLGQQRQLGKSAEELYRELKEQATAAGIEQWPPWTAPA